MTDQRVVTGMRRQIESRDGLLASGYEAIGWKIAMDDPGVRASFGLASPLVGYLTSASLLATDDTHSLSGAVDPRLEVELALHLRADDGSLDGAMVGAALELVDIDRPIEPIADVVAANIFHRGVVLGPPVPLTDVARQAIPVRLHVDGALARSAETIVQPERLDAVVETVRAALEPSDARLRCGDRIICGAIAIPLEVAAGEDVHAAFGGGLGSLTLRFAP